jgi:hypothetical protein
MKRGAENGRLASDKKQAWLLSAAYLQQLEWRVVLQGQAGAGWGSKVPPKNFRL